MLRKVTAISALVLIFIALIAGFILLFKYVIRPLHLGLAGDIDIAIGAILLLVIWIRAFLKPDREEKQNCATKLFRWLGPVLATFLFVGIYKLIITFDTMQQCGCLYVLSLISVMTLASLFPPPYAGADDSDDYHASRGW